jgi:hypothetical protein
MSHHRIYLGWQYEDGDFRAISLVGCLEWEEETQMITEDIRHMWRGGGSTPHPTTLNKDILKMNMEIVLSRPDY